jgi:hypothetical protein
MENNVVISQKLKVKLTYDVEILLLDINPKEIKIGF